MSHIHHIIKNKHLLVHRAQIIQHLREFFWSRDFQEVETPLLLRLPGQEPYLFPMNVQIHDDKGTSHSTYLHTSPEYTMKKMIASGFGNIFSICKTFRDHESFGGTHNPEFTMIEWYRVDSTIGDLMDDVEHVFHTLQTNLQQHMKDMLPSPIPMFQRRSMKELWQLTINVDLDNYLDASSMLELCKNRGYSFEKDETYEDLFYRIFLNEIEPTLAKGSYIIHHYPAPMAALAQLSKTELGYAERFEVYVNGIEIANAFTELTDADEQLTRLQEEQALRAKLGKSVYDIDMDFIAAVSEMPPCAGIALGVDRLVQVLLGVEDIDDVLVVPMSKMIGH